MMFDIIGKRLWFFLITAVVLLVSIISLATFGLKAGIEFSSGSLMTIGFEQEVDQGALKQELANLGYANVIIQRVGEDDFLIRLPELSGAAKTELEDGLTAGWDIFGFANVSASYANMQAATDTMNPTSGPVAPMSSSARFRSSSSSREPLHEPPYPPSEPSPAMTRWQGTIRAIGLRPTAPPTARAAP